MKKEEKMVLDAMKKAGKPVQFGDVAKKGNLGDVVDYVELIWGKTCMLLGVEMVSSLE